MNKKEVLENHLQYVPVDRVEEFKELAEMLDFEPDKLRAISKAMRMNVCKELVRSMTEIVHAEDMHTWLINFLDSRKENPLPEYFYTTGKIQLVNGEVMDKITSF